MLYLFNLAFTKELGGGCLALQESLPFFSYTNVDAPTNTKMVIQGRKEEIAAILWKIYPANEVEQEISPCENQLKMRCSWRGP